METYSSGAVWNNPPVGLNRLETEDSETSKAVFHFLRATWQDYPGKSFFLEQILALSAHSPSLLQRCQRFPTSLTPRSPKFPVVSASTGVEFWPQKFIACGCAERFSWKQKAHIAFRNRRKFWLGRELKIHLFPVPYHGQFPLSQTAQILKRQIQSGHWEVLLFDVI